MVKKADEIGLIGRIFMMIPSSTIFSSGHLRSFCLSFLLLASLFTCINFLATSTSTYKLVPTGYKSEQNLTTENTNTSPLSLSNNDIFYNRFSCDENNNHPRLVYENSLTIYKKKKNVSSSFAMEFYQPNITSMELQTILYDYENWQSTSLMPRVVTKCEHNLMIQLLKRFDLLTKKYSLEYMMTDGTLLGSWRHHDLIPWDDDVDLLMSVKLKQRLDEAIQLESSSLLSKVEFHRHWDGPKEFEYYKFYFSASPHFSEYPWSYPFVDLIFYHENRTHLWQENMQNSTSILKTKVFPLELRPFGSLWLPSPKSPHDYFLSINWKTYDTECFNGEWSHKYETLKRTILDYESKAVISCRKLRQFYPFVERSSNHNEEKLILDGENIQTIHLNENK